MNTSTRAARAPVAEASTTRVVPVAPSSARHISNEIVTVSDAQGARAEAIRALRTHIVAQHIHVGRRALAICAPSIGVGTTFVAANLAVALSQIGIKTLLIDADLRDPGVDKLIPPAKPDIGLRQCLASREVSFTEVIESEVLPELSIMYAGGQAANPQELLAGERFQELMDICMRDFDVTIVDTPPANRSADVRRISNVVGYSLVVARRNKSLVDDVRTLVSELQADHAVIVGTVLNEA